ncbi:MAG: hypothetical protein CSB34_06890 [Desulfobulbus propionicus]|nr:MAG: hypothetical protein CSB34_06890 [Desulfobulbus propionicus]
MKNNGTGAVLSRQKDHNNHHARESRLARLPIEVTFIILGVFMDNSLQAQKRSFFTNTNKDIPC